MAIKVAPALDEDAVECIDMERYSEHSQTVRYKAVSSTEDHPVVRSLYVERLAMPNPRKPPQRIRVAVAFLK